MPNVKGYGPTSARHACCECARVWHTCVGLLDSCSRVGAHPLFSSRRTTRVFPGKKRLRNLLKAREYTRALTAVKLDKMFAKPLVGALDGHGDGVFCSAASKRNLVQFLSGDVVVPPAYRIMQSNRQTAAVDMLTAPAVVRRSRDVYSCGK